MWIKCLLCKNSYINLIIKIIIVLIKKKRQFVKFDEGSLSTNKTEGYAETLMAKLTGINVIGRKECIQTH